MSVASNEHYPTLASLIEPLSVGDFIAEYFDQKPLFLTGGQNRFESFADKSILLDLIHQGLPWLHRRAPEFYLNGGFIPHEKMYQTYEDMDDLKAKKPNLRLVELLLSKGATFNCFGLDQYFPDLLRLRKQLSCELNAEVQSSFFYSQKDAPGLAPHYDCVEILVLQVYGTKEWYVSEQRVENPQVGFGAMNTYDQSAGHSKITLNSGDLLYLPRGVFHHACSVSEESLHVSIAMKFATYVDVLDVLHNRVDCDNQLRAYLPIGQMRSKTWNRQAMAELMTRVLSDDSFVNSLADKVQARTDLRS